MTAEEEKFYYEKLLDALLDVVEQTDIKEYELECGGLTFHIKVELNGKG